MNYNIIFILSAIITISGCLIYSYSVMGICCVLPIIYLAYDIIRNYRVPRCKIPCYNWCCWLMAGLLLVAFYWNSGGDLAGFQ